MVQRVVFNSCWLHYALLVLLIAGATTGGLVVLGCQPPGGSSAVNPNQAAPFGGVRFKKDDPSQQARVDLEPTYWGEKVKWKVPKGMEDWVKIPDDQRSNEIAIQRPPAGTWGEVRIDGEYVKDGTVYHLPQYVHVEAVK